MTKYSLRTRMMILILAPTLLIGLLLSTSFVVHRYNELQEQLVNAGVNIIEPLVVARRVRHDFPRPRIDQAASQSIAPLSFRDCAFDYRVRCAE